MLDDLRRDEAAERAVGQRVEIGQGVGVHGAHAAGARRGRHVGILVGHSTGGGEVARYIGRHGTDRVAKAVLISGVPPLDGTCPGLTAAH